MGHHPRRLHRHAFQIFLRTCYHSAPHARCHLSTSSSQPCHAARLGQINTPHGQFDTPAFMPVGTQGTIKGILPDHVAATGAQIILANTYHLMLRPGEKVVAELGDLHRFMAWPGPILTDCGRVSGFLAGGHQQDHRRRRDVQEPHRRRCRPSHARRDHAGAERPRGGHHHGV